jgi:DNA-binding LacI/PurR family transcriptional regulator
MPLVLVNGAIDGLDVPTIANDDVAAIEMAIAHLTELGHVRIGLAAGPDRFIPVIRKLWGFRGAMARHTSLSRAEIDDLIVHELFTVDGGAAAAARLLDRGVTAIAAASDLMALGAVRAVRARGLRVPQDVSVIGYDDSPLIAFSDPPLTTIRQNVTAMSETAVNSLVEIIGGSDSRAKEFTFRPELVVRGSTAPCVVQARERHTPRARGLRAAKVSDERP